jgi:hypothetical protein
MASHEKLDEMRGLLVGRVDRQKLALATLRDSLEASEKDLVEDTAKRLAEVERERDSARKEGEQLKVGSLLNSPLMES